MEIVPKKVNDKMHLAMIIGYCVSLLYSFRNYQNYTNNSDSLTRYPSR